MYCEHSSTALTSVMTSLENLPCCTRWWRPNGLDPAPFSQRLWLVIGLLRMADLALPSETEQGGGPSSLHELDLINDAFGAPVCGAEVARRWFRLVLAGYGSLACRRRGGRPRRGGGATTAPGCTGQWVADQLCGWSHEDVEAGCSGRWPTWLWPTPTTQC